VGNALPVKGNRFTVIPTLPKKKELPSDRDLQRARQNPSENDGVHKKTGEDVKERLRLMESFWGQKLAGLGGGRSWGQREGRGGTSSGEVANHGGIPGWKKRGGQGPEKAGGISLPLRGALPPLLEKEKKSPTILKKYLERTRNGESAKKGREE